jgi:hypothetical protein
MQEELDAGRRLGNWDYKARTDEFMIKVQELNKSLRKV